MSDRERNYSLPTTARLCLVLFAAAISGTRVSESETHASVY
jgi:hypothetical protein